jgi:monoamine oxidase
VNRSGQPPKRPDRREFLASAALAGAAVTLHGCSLPASPPFDVAVIGAGMAGLAAARDLSRAGLDIVVLEARDRAGGRMESLEGPAPHGLEIGAQMIHGSRAPIWPLLRELGIEARPLDQWTRWQWTPAGGFRRPGTEHGAALRARLEEAYHAYRGEDIPYGKFLETLSIPQEDLGLVNENALSWSAEPEEISLQAAMEDQAAWEAYLDTNYQVIGGYATLAGKMAGPLGDRVRLSCPVTGIDWRRGRVRLSCVRSGREERVHARRLLVTCRLASGRLAADPDLRLEEERHQRAADGRARCADARPPLAEPVGPGAG